MTVRIGAVTLLVVALVLGAPALDVESKPDVTAEGARGPFPKREW